MGRPATTLAEAISDIAAVKGEADFGTILSGINDVTGEADTDLTAANLSLAACEAQTEESLQAINDVLERVLYGTHDDDDTEETE